MSVARAQPKDAKARASLLAELPDDVRQLVEPHMDPGPETLASISVAIAHRRDEAKTARTSSGVEQTWKECEEAYVGVDDANRAEFQDAKWSKPMSMDGPVTTGRAPRQNDHKSTAYVRLTARYVDAGAAKLAEILLPADDKAFSIRETPVPELIKAKDDNTQVVHDGLGNAPLTRPARPDELSQMAPSPPSTAPGPVPPPPAGGPATAAAPAVGAVLPAGAAGAPASPPQHVPLTVKDLAEEAIEMARAKAKKAEERIYNWMVDCQYTAEMRKVIFDAARIGVGVLKGPFPKASRGMAVTKGPDGAIALDIKESIAPATKWVDPWNVFPDPACGENIHEGDYIFERDYISERQLRGLKKVPGYIEAAIDGVIAEGPNKANVNSDVGEADASKASRKNRYEIWYYYGTLTRDEMSSISTAAGATADLPSAQTSVYAIVTMVNDKIIRATINPLDSGSFPYHSVPWQRRAGHWAGIGVAEQSRMPQKTLNAATRAMLNNAGKSAGSMIVLDQAAIVPADGSWVMTPDKIWYKVSDSEGSDVRQAMTAIEIPNVTEPLMKIVNYALQLAEESTSIPLITQGQSGATTPDTFGAAQLQNNNANQLLRSIGYAFDDYITEPVVRQFYEWLLLDPEVPDDEKGEFVINAHGSVALVERAIQDQTIAQMAAMVMQPAYGIDPKKWAKMFLKSKRLDPAEVQYTEEEQAKLDATPPPPAPAVQVAQIVAQTEAQKLAAAQTSAQRSDTNEREIAQAAQVLEGKKIETAQHATLTEATVKLHELQTRHDLALLDYANKHRISLDAAKAALAKTAMTINAEKELNAANAAVDLHKHHNPSPKPVMKPAAQAPGRAGNGRAFSQSGPAQ